MIIVYFGDFPDYFQLWLNSCRYNSSIDFLIFTDNDMSYDVPSNVKFIKTNLKKIKEIAQRKFDFNISLEYSYKLCDYKPAYGLIFEEYLTNYDFWGYCDIDVIFGNLRKFLDEDYLCNYDKIYRAGHFTLYKNDEKNKLGFEKIMDENNGYLYKSVFSTDSSFYFDEFYGIFKLYGKDDNYQMYSNLDVIADISHKYNEFMVVEQFSKKNFAFRWNTDSSNCELIGLYKDKNNKIVEKEFMYVHLQKRNMKICNTINDNYFIIPNKFVNNCNLNLVLNKPIFIRISYLNYKIKRFIQRKIFKGAKI